MTRTRTYTDWMSLFGCAVFLCGASGGGAARTAERASLLSAVQRERGCIVAEQGWRTIIQQVRIANSRTPKLASQQPLLLEDGRARTFVRGYWVPDPDANILSCAGFSRAAGSSFKLLKSADVAASVRESGVRQFYSIISIPIVSADGTVATLFLDYKGNDSAYQQDGIITLWRVDGHWLVKSTQISPALAPHGGFRYKADEPPPQRR